MLHSPITQLANEGYCVIEQVLSAELINTLRQSSSEALQTLDQQHRQSNRSQGSLINLSDYPAFADVIGNSALQSVFEQLHMRNTVFSSGYIISKPANSPPLFWHQDWWGWDDSISYTDTLAQFFVMIYLTDTTAENGCLRVIPASHRRRHAMHKTIESRAAAHAEDLSRVSNPEDPLYQSFSYQVNVPVRAGDVVIGDARLLHGAHGNQTRDERTLLTLWYHPEFEQLPTGMQARIQQIFDRKGVDTDPDSGMVITEWPMQQLNKVAHLLPNYTGTAKPHEWNREPQLERL